MLILIFSIKILFFLPPPHSKTLKDLSFKLDKRVINASPITLAVKSVNVAAPSSSESPRTKEISKSFTSKDKGF